MPAELTTCLRRKPLRTPELVNPHSVAIEGLEESGRSTTNSPHLTLWFEKNGVSHRFAVRLALTDRPNSAPRARLSEPECYLPRQSIPGWLG